MTEILRLIAAATPERAALLVVALVVFALGYALRWALSENQAMRRELAENHSLHLQLLEFLITGKNNEKKALLSLDQFSGCADLAPDQPESGPTFPGTACGDAGSPESGHHQLPLKGADRPRQVYQSPKLKQVGRELNCIPHFQMALPAILTAMGRCAR